MLKTDVCKAYCKLNKDIVIICCQVCDAINFKINLTFLIIEAVVQRCSVKKVFLEISQNSQENTCARVSFLIKLQA